MKRTIHPGNVSEGDIVEFTLSDCHTKSGSIILSGTKARFLEWIEEGGIEFAYASVIPIGVDGLTGWVWTNPDILVVEED